MAICKISPKKEIRLVAAKLNVKVRFRKTAKSAFCRMAKREITIPNQELGRDQLFSLFFHEYAHQVCYDLHIYDNYHRGDVKSDGFSKVMLPAERHVDKMGRKFARLYDKNIRYCGWYLETPKGEVRRFLEDYYKIKIVRKDKKKSLTTVEPIVY